VTVPSLLVATLAVAAGVTALLLLLGWLRQRGLAAGEQAWLPAELRTAKLVYSEREFITDSPVPLGARVDRVYALPDGKLVLVEFKRRAGGRVFPADIVQLSVQRVVIEQATSARVASHAYVALIDARSGRIRTRRVELECEPELLARYQRARAVLTGTTSALKTQDLVICRSCAFAGHCRPELARPDAPPG
jgi:hypothetical protein